MAFDTINKVSEQELTPALQAKINSKAEQADLTSHKNNMIMHITAEERDKWNSILDQSKTYTDERFNKIIGSLGDLANNTTIMDLLNLKLNTSDFNTFKGTLAKVATSGNFDDLSNKPTSAAYSDKANYATTSGTADNAKKADYATNAGTANYANNAGRVNGIRVSIGSATPSSPVNNAEVWFNTNIGAFMAYINGAWIQSKGIWY